MDDFAIWVDEKDFPPDSQTATLTALVQQMDEGVNRFVDLMNHPERYIDMEMVGRVAEDALARGKKIQETIEEYGPALENVIRRQRKTKEKQSRELERED